MFMIRYIIIFMAVSLILSLSTSCGDTTPPEPPVNIEYSIGANINTIYISWEQAPDTTEELFYLVNFLRIIIFHNYTFFSSLEEGQHTIHAKCKDVIGSTNELAMQFFVDSSPVNIVIESPDRIVVGTYTELKVVSEDKNEDGETRRAAAEALKKLEMHTSP